MRDQRATKTNPRQPDYKCVVRSCDGAVWLDRKRRNGAPSNPLTQEDQSTRKKPSLAELDRRHDALVAEQYQLARERRAALLERLRDVLTPRVLENTTRSTVGDVFAKCLAETADNLAREPYELQRLHAELAEAIMGEIRRSGTAEIAHVGRSTFCGPALS